MAMMGTTGQGFKDTLDGVSRAPGYREVSMHLTVCTSPTDKNQTEKMEVMLDKDDAWYFFQHQ